MNARHAIGRLTLALAAFGCRDVSSDLGRRDTTVGPPTYSAAPSQTGVFHVAANGDFGNVSWSSNTLFGFANVSTAFPGDTLGFSYFIFQFDPCCSQSGGFGPISRSDVMGSGGGRLVFNANTCTEPGFLTFAGACGPVVIEFDKTSFFSGRNEGTSVQNYGSFSFHSSGTSEFSSANAIGSVVGFPIVSPNSATMGMNHNVAISISRQ